ncbi:hypothetical protein PHLGIDRAFT_27349 [Phlebiopsis gigantea 11061_1 CR5-6]|uniref:Uncharacterized protein n=1 Tax=Phlebiopsis gigantea (strain 11061_1 CR5-6) TaxID=745531 RepID=A0A0C3PWX3_PHLG1|nr:hypothetical protein PHLGIDRAFT_27349 [Phlebiopsis gigantea 11061_1 CR5-6]
MSTRRKVGFSSSASEASRRQLMQPVPCWEKVWALPDVASPGSTLKVYKWVKTDKRQQFSDDEEETDQPLAPLPDDSEVVEGDDELDPDEGNASVAPESVTTPASREVSEPVQSKEESKPATPKPHPLSVSFQPPSPSPPPPDDGLDESLKPAEGILDDIVDGIIDPMESDLALDMSQMGPDGEPFEGANEISQLQASDALLGAGPLLDDAMGDDPFAGDTS